MPSQWIDDALPAVDQAVNRLVDEFLASPYQHRSEHSLHARLVVLLSATEMFVEPVTLAQQNPNSWSTAQHTTQALQLEWPVRVATRRETTGRGSSRGRERYDLVIFNPRTLRVRPSTFEQQASTLQPEIAIEIGLRAYDRLGHLTGDRDKMLRNEIPYPYLIDLSRGPFNVGIEREINALREPFRVAYACFGTNGSRIKYTHHSECGRAGDNWAFSSPLAWTRRS